MGKRELGGEESGIIGSRLKSVMSSCASSVSDMRTVMFVEMCPAPKK